MDVIFEMYHLLADQVQNYIATVFPNGSGTYQQANVPCRAAKIGHEWFEKHDKEKSRCSLGVHLILQIRICGTCTSHHEGSSSQPSGLKESAVTHHTFRGLVESRG